MNKSLGTLKKGFNSAKSVVGNFTNSLFSLRGGIGALIGAAGLGALTKHSIEAADTIAKTADKVGIATSTLQELRYGAKLAGVDQKTLGMAMQRFSRRVGEAANGTGELVGTLEQYNIKVRNSDGSMRSLEAIMGDYSNAIQSAESDQERLRLAFKAFDSEGAALVNLLRNGERGLSAMRKEAQSLGVVIDENLVRNAEKANDKLDILQQIIGVKMTSAVLTLAPQIISLTQGIIDLMPKIVRAAELFVDVTGKIIKWGETLSKYLPHLYIMRKAYGLFSDDVKKNTDTIEKNTDTLKISTDVVDDYIKNVDKISTALGEAVNSQANQTTAANAQIKTQNELNKSTVTLSSVTGDLMTRAQNAQISGWKDVGKVALDVLQDIINAQIKSAQTSTFSSSDIGGGISSIFSGITSSVSSLFGGISIPGFATGGEFTVSGGPVGTDKVPVSFMATNGERVRVETPQQQRSSNAGSGTQVVYNIDARGAEAGVEQRIMQVLKQLDASIESRAVNAVRRKNIRNPSFLGA